MISLLQGFEPSFGYPTWTQYPDVKLHLSIFKSRIYRQKPTFIYICSLFSLIRYVGIDWRATILSPFLMKFPKQRSWDESIYITKFWNLYINPWYGFSNIFPIPTSFMWQNLFIERWCLDQRIWGWLTTWLMLTLTGMRPELTVPCLNSAAKFLTCQVRTCLLDLTNIFFMTFFFCFNKILHFWRVRLNTA